MIVALTFAIVIGLSLGLLGSGGSILTLPVLVYGAGVDEHDAVAMSLVVVGLTAAVGGILQAMKGLVDWRSAGLFALGGMGGAIPGGYLSHVLPGQILMLIFAVLMLLVGIRMLRGNSVPSREGSELRVVNALGAGAGVGALTAFLGAGGGFLIVPALMRFLGLPLGRAMATSLVVIAANCAAGLVVHGGQAQFDWELTASFTGLALIGMVGGVVLSRRLPVGGLRIAFGVSVLLMAVFVLFQNRSFFVRSAATLANPMIQEKRTNSLNHVLTTNL